MKARSTQQTTPSININDQPWAECECKGNTFRSTVMFKRISSLISQSGSEEIIPIEVFVCNRCNKVPGFVADKLPIMPELMKASKSIVNLDTDNSIMVSSDITKD